MYGPSAITSGTTRGTKDPWFYDLVNYISILKWATCIMLHNENRCRSSKTFFSHLWTKGFYPMMTLIPNKNWSISSPSQAWNLSPQRKRSTTVFHPFHVLVCKIHSDEYVFLVFVLESKHGDLRSGLQLSTIEYCVMMVWMTSFKAFSQKY